MFDVVVKPQKRSPYSKMSQNELAKELYRLGFFNPQMSEQTLAAMELMDFDGQEKVRDHVQQGQTLMNQLMQMQQMMTKLGIIVYQTTGRDVLGLMDGGPKAAESAANPAPTGKSMGSAVTDAQKGTMTSYGEKLAKHATPDMNAQ